MACSLTSGVLLRDRVSVSELGEIQPMASKKVKSKSSIASNIRDAVKAVVTEATRATPDYEYDIFISYVRGAAFQEWLHRALGIFETWLALELGRRPILFYDSSVLPGEAWHQEMIQALRTSRCMVP